MSDLRRPKLKICCTCSLRSTTKTIHFRPVGRPVHYSRDQGYLATIGVARQLDAGKSYAPSKKLTGVGHDHRARVEVLERVRRLRCCSLLRLAIPRSAGRFYEDGFAVQGLRPAS